MVREFACKNCFLPQHHPLGSSSTNFRTKTKSHAQTLMPLPTTTTHHHHDRRVLHPPVTQQKAGLPLSGSTFLAPPQSHRQRIEEVSQPDQNPQACKPTFWPAPQEAAPGAALTTSTDDGGPSARRRLSPRLPTPPPSFPEGRPRGMESPTSPPRPPSSSPSSLPRFCSTSP